MNISVSGGIENMALISKRDNIGFYPLIKLRDQSGRTPTSLFLNAVLDLSAGNRTGIPPRIYYLPAARGGIMQSHHIFASHLVARSTRSGLESFPEPPMVSGVTADFLQHLILNPYTGSHGQDDILGGLADTVEKENLLGSVTASGPPRSYPYFAYRPSGSGGDVPITRASSMVAELAPIVFFLRGIVKAGDTLIVEEPEAHLHPAAQTRIAGALAQLIHPRDVGIWLFRQGGAEQGATVQEVPYDQTEGVEPAEYDDVAEELYNRAAYLQNKLEESRDDA